MTAEVPARQQSQRAPNGCSVGGSHAVFLRHRVVEFSPPLGRLFHLPFFLRETVPKPKTWKGSRMVAQTAIDINRPVLVDGRTSQPSRPPWLLDAVISPREAAALVDVGLETASHWLKAAKLMGLPMHRKIGSRRLLNGHQAYRLAILAALHEAGIACGADVLRAVYAMTHRDGQPVLPDLFESVVLNEVEDGKPAAAIVVDIGTIWLGFEPRLAAMMRA